MTGGHAVGRTRFPALGTTAELLTWPGGALDEACLVLEEHLAAIDLACSRFRPDSELCLLNRAGGRWTGVSPLLLEAVQVALTAARQTDGAVDPTVGRALGLLGYDRDFALVAMDGPPLEVKLEAVPGWRCVEVDRRRGRLRAPAGVQLDLGSTGKALAADRAARAIAGTTGAGVLVCLGGDLCTAGPTPPGGWPVHVTDDHRQGVSHYGQTVTLAGGGLATSSTSARRWARGAERLHHIVDPRTGGPVEGPWRTVSVAAATCVEANTAATAALVKGRGGRAWLGSTGLPGRLVGHDGQVVRLNEWPAPSPGTYEVVRPVADAGALA